MKQVRFVHIRLPGKPSKGGATVRLMPAKPDKEGKPMVKMQVAICSPEDSFWRAWGRLEAQKRPVTRVYLQTLPVELAELENQVQSMAGIARSKRAHTDFSYVLKAFTPAWMLSMPSPRRPTLQVTPKGGVYVAAVKVIEKEKEK